MPQTEVSIPQSDGRRPNTIAAQNSIEVTSEQLADMSVPQLTDLARNTLGLVVEKGITRTKLLTRIINAAVGVRETG